MGRVYSDTERLIHASELSSNGHHGRAAGIYQKMGNEVRKPSEKKSLWGMAKDSRIKRDR